MPTHFLAPLLVLLSSLTGAEEYPRKLVHYETPAYPAVAVAVKATGEVKLDITVDEDGRVVMAVPTGGHPLLRKAAADAARQWRFAKGTPANLDVAIIFNLGKRNRTKLRKPYRLEFTHRPTRILDISGSDSRLLALK